jgi:hypothetical protein
MSHNMTELHDHLFDTLKGVKDGSMDIDRAKTVALIADKLIAAAKVEVDYLNVVGLVCAALRESLRSPPWLLRALRGRFLASPALAVPVTASAFSGAALR